MFSLRLRFIGGCDSLAVASSASKRGLNDKDPRE
jgi:hypothetical protein